jgi:hypothetical protein
MKLNVVYNFKGTYPIHLVLGLYHLPDQSHRWQQKQKKKTKFTKHENTVLYWVSY